MLTREELWQLTLEQIADHLIDDDSYFALDVRSLHDFYTWAEHNHHKFTDVDGLDIDQMFAHWTNPPTPLAA